jgi:type IV pilus assembly protein PilM
MVFNFLKRNNKPHIGLDISPVGITATILEKNKNKFFLKKFAYEPFNQAVIQKGLISNSEGFTDTLKKIIESLQSDIKNVSIGIPSYAAIIKTITLPSMPLNELKVIIHQEASKHVPIPIDEVNIDFEILPNPKSQEESNEKIDIILTAAAKSIIENYVNQVQKTGLNVLSVDITPFAMIRTLSNTNLIDDSDNIYISVLIGYENTDITIIYKGMPLFSNSAPIGEKHVIESLVNNPEFDNSMIEELLPQVALIIPGMNVEDLDPQLSKAASTVRTVYNNISGEIQKTIEFYYSQNTESMEIKKIILGGSGICVQNVDKYIANRLKIDTVLCNPLENITHSLDQNLINQTNIPSLATSVGLALKGM